MHSSLRIQDYIFDTVALRNAFKSIDTQQIPHEPDYTSDAVYALFDYFCDWSPARKEDITNSASQSLDSITSSEREADFNECCDHLADTLQEQYSMQASQEDVVRLARLLGEDGPC